MSCLLHFTGATLIVTKLISFTYSRPNNCPLSLIPKWNPTNTIYSHSNNIHQQSCWHWVRHGVSIGLVRWPRGIMGFNRVFWNFQGNFRLQLQRSTSNRDSTFQHRFVISASTAQSLFSTLNCDWNFQPRFRFSTLNCDSNFQPRFRFATLNCDSNSQLRLQLSTAIATLNRDSHFQRSTAIPTFNRDSVFQRSTANFQLQLHVVNTNAMKKGTTCEVKVYQLI